MARGGVKQSAAGAPVEGPWTLPEGWHWERLETVGRWGSGGTPNIKTPRYYGGDIPWFRSGELRDRPLADPEIKITEEGLQGSSAKLIAPGAVLVAMYGATVGKLAISTRVCATNQAIAFCIPDLETITARYLFFYLLSIRRHLRDQAQGGAQPNISQSLLKEQIIPVPPVARQALIVARIDELFAEVDNGEAALARARDDLATWRKALLKAAVTGELTADWRATNLPNKTGADLLAHVLADRRERWKARPASTGKRYVEPASADQTGLPMLPDGWAWSSMGQLLDRIEAGLNVKCVERPPVGDETGLLKISAVTWWRFNERASKTLADSHVHPDQWLIADGDLLLSRANTLELVGAPAIVENLSLRLMLSDKVLRLAMPAYLRRWTFYVLRSPYGRAWIESHSTGNQLSMRNISQDALRAMPIPLPPRIELDRIVEILDAAAVQHETTVSDVGIFDAAAATLRQSILAAAFCGDLA
ncbi:restriction endonuclease subunit S [Sphingomonas aerolata]|uniref:restriction endonuclease subunit S n=1 Tax=Sphingomonas aerolata TaxID=185951 RepID=UPI002FE42222